MLKLKKKINFSVVSTVQNYCESELKLQLPFNDAICHMN